MYLKKPLSNNRPLHRCLLMAFLLPFQMSFALPEDALKEMIILSDHAELDRKAGKVIYAGNVILTQGTLTIHASRLVITQTHNQLQKARAEGNPATYQQQIQAGQGMTNAQGNRIDYLAKQKEIQFQGNARLEQEGNIFSGDRIWFDMEQERIVASGKEAASPEATSRRIKVIIQPEQQP